MVFTKSHNGSCNVVLYCYGGDRAVTLHHLVWNTKKNVYLCYAQSLLLQLTIERNVREMFIHH